MDKIPMLGKIITEPQGRDAVHIAVAPVIAGHPLDPGTRIGFTGADKVGVDAKIIGIVDPFLTRTVATGEMFYMFLLPNTITSLRHEWTHPDFEDQDVFAEMDRTFEKLKEPPEKLWLINYANSIGVDYDEIIEAADNYQSTGEYFCRGGDFEGMSIPAEFWDCYEVVKKTKVTGRRNSFFTCSC